MALMKVDLPQPLGPMMATCSPAPMRREMSSSASVAPRATETRSNSISGGCKPTILKEAPMSSRVWLMRHGETAWSLSGQHTSRTDLPLTEQGESRAVALGKVLAGRKFARVFSSPMLRARETCRLAGYTPEITEDLHEWDYGAYEGLTTAQIQKTA